MFIKRASPAEARTSFHYKHSSFLHFCHALGLKIALILLLRHFWTLNLSSFKQRKGNNIYRLARTWSSYKYSNVAENGRTLKVSLQQRSSKVTWNYTWNLTPLKSPWNLRLTLRFSQHDREFFCLLQYFISRGIKLAASQADRLRSACSLAIIYFYN